MIYAPSADHDLYAITADGSVEWQQTLGASVNSVAYRDRRLYATCENGTLSQINIRGGTDWETSLGSGIASTPAVTDEQVFAGTRDGTPYALDTRDGVERWRFTQPSNGVTAPPSSPTGSSTSEVATASSMPSTPRRATRSGPSRRGTTSRTPPPSSPAATSTSAAKTGTFYALSE